MEKKLTILEPFFEKPNNRFSIRELSRIININHTTVRQYLNTMVEEGVLNKKNEGVYTFYMLNITRKTQNLKLYYNLEKIRKSGIIEGLEKFYDYPVIILFGGYANATDDMTSDIDICVLSNIKKEILPDVFEKKLNRKLSILKFSKRAFEMAKKNNPELINNICNGIVLSGEFEVL